MGTAEQQTETTQQLNQLHGCHHKGMSLTALQVLSHTSGCQHDMGDWVSWYVSGCQGLGEPRRGQRRGRHVGQASFACGALADPRLQFRHQAGMFAKSLSLCTENAPSALHSWKSWPLSAEVACLDILLFTCHAFEQSLAPITLHHTAHTNS